MLVALLCFGVLGAEAATERAGGFESRLLRALRGTADAGLTEVMRAASVAGSGWVVGPLAGAVALALWRRRGGVRAAVFAVEVAGAAATEGLKLLFNRPRPEVVPHLVDVSSASFPSGHAAQTAALAAALLTATWPQCARGALRGTLLAGLAAYVGLVGLSRLYLGVHYPSDVLGGWSFALAWVAAVAAVAGRAAAGPSAARPVRPLERPSGGRARMHGTLRAELRRRLGWRA